MTPPPFDVEGGAALAAMRALSVAGLLSVFGTLVFGVAVMPRVSAKLREPDRGRVARRLLAATQAGVAVALAGTLAWLAVQAASMASAASPREWLAAVPKVAAQTRFGHLALLQMLALAAVPVALGRRGRPARLWTALGLSCVALGLQAGHSHAASMSPRTNAMLGLDLLHLAGAGAWLGGLLPLLLVVDAAPVEAGVIAARWFSPLGKLCIAALAVSAIGQGWVLVGSLAGLLGTAYGWIILLKLALFAILLGFAIANRYRFAPALLRSGAGRARIILMRSIALQTGFGLAVVFAAAVLSNLPPAMHVQPVWPLGERFSLDAVREDTSLRNEVLGALLALAAGVLLSAACIRLRPRLAWFALPAAAAIAWFAVPHLDLLLVPAYPTSYDRSPTGFTAAAILNGAALYPAHCAACHGTSGRGDTAAAATLPVPPADLTAPHLWMHSDGELFWWLSHGIAAPNGQPAMPGFGDVLSKDQRWNLIDYIRARNAGLAFAATGAWPVPVQAPDLQARCAGGTLSLADLQGKFVRLVVRPTRPVVSSDEATTILLANGGAAGACTADGDLAGAYAIVAGLAPAQLPNAEFLVDGSGWLRAVHPGGSHAGDDWNDARTLGTIIARLKAAPLAPVAHGVPMPMKM